jgi:hypothetical protein
MIETDTDTAPKTVNRFVLFLYVLDTHKTPQCTGFLDIREQETMARD